ncbi:hypothetical protein ACFO3D_15000 [Virgibacillus kekensis]|uniref:Glycogen biosynthesis protein GlgD n=1 Tax=Virgibacillus kekensis TaxID=202261 RepID=A0ABV9DKX0_9BACI
MVNNDDKRKTSSRQMKHEREVMPDDKFDNPTLDDEMPQEDVKIEQRQERKKHKSQDASSSERKFPGEGK